LFFKSKPNCFIHGRMSGKYASVNLTLIAGLCFAVSGWAATISDDFNDGNDTAPTIAWQRYDPISDATGGAVALASWEFPGGNSYRLLSQPSPDPSTFGQARLGSFAPGVFTNFYVAADVVNWDPTVHQILGIVARVGTIGPGQTTGYLFDWDNGNPESATAGDMDIVRLENETAVDLDTNNYFGDDPIHLETGHSYRFVFMGVGNAFRGQVYDLTNTVVPLVDYGVTDPDYDPQATHHVSGLTGVLAANNASAMDGSADATFDNFLATDGPLLSESFPLLSVSRAPSGSVSVSWPLGDTYTLQASPTVTSTSWTALAPGATNGAWNVYTVPQPTGNQFFKLTR
jgi:hypothetical protein